MPVLRLGTAWRHAMLVVQQEHLLSCSGSVRRAVAGDAMALGGVLVFATARQRRLGSSSTRSMQAGGFQCESGVESVQRPRAELVRATHWFCGIGNREGARVQVQRSTVPVGWYEDLARQ
jgi:hypothetical protein